jgi:dissimilatory sulfite reductase (desulfoviridin) alpha/beta subunit
MTNKLDKLLKELKVYRNDMVARNYPHQRISDIITRYEMKDFLEEAEKEKKELEESYQESVRQTKERKNFHPKAIDGYSE